MWANEYKYTQAKISYFVEENKLGYILLQKSW